MVRGRTLWMGAVLGSLLNAPVGAQQSADITGRWMGALEVPGATLRLMVEVEDGDGGLTAMITSLDQGNAEIPVGTTTETDGLVVLDVPAIAARYEGTLSDEGARMEGTWTQGGNALPLIFARTDEEPEPPRRPQHPQAPFPYSAEEVTFENPIGGHVLAGTLTVPPGTGPFPAVVLISGSGPQDRDESLLGHKPFLVLADHLTRAGISVLRFDDRGTAASGGDFATATSEDFATDVAAAVAWLRARDDVNANRVGLVGHSEGGLIAPMVANASDEVAFVVLLAGPGVDGERILLGQQAAILRAGGATEETIAESARTQAEIHAVLRRSTPDEAAEALRPLLRASLAPSVGDSALDQAVSSAVARVNSPWFRFFLEYDPAPALERLGVPVLALIGQKDLQVLAEDNAPAIEAALQRGGNPDWDVRVLPGLNHLFQTAATGSPNEYQTIEETFSPDALRLVSDWILARSR